MYYTLKCDAATTQDNFVEWDYTTYTRLYNQKMSIVHIFIIKILTLKLFPTITTLSTIFFKLLLIILL